MNWELTLKILGSFVALIGAIYQLRQFNPIKRSRLKADLEILEKIDKKGENYQLVNSYVSSQIKIIYTHKESKFKIYNVKDFVIGVITLVVFTIFSVYIYNERGFSWWLLLSGFVSLSGFGNILVSLDKPIDSEILTDKKTCH